jgi:insertion element IS1 protein InsB
MKCKACGRQFVTQRTHAPLSDECKRRIELLLAERISLEGICRVLEIKPHQLYAYMDELYEELPSDLACSVHEQPDIELINIDSEADELWSFVGEKANKQWLWVALDRATRQIVALFIGDRSAAGALGLWQALPERYRQQATFHTDDWDAYKRIIPAHQHRFSQQKKDTNHAERFFCTLRHRCSRLVRLSLSFSKKLDRHVNSIRFVVTHYNLSLQV